jgi:pyruvate formate lyase activating enzyme
LLQEPEETIPLVSVLANLASRRGWIDGVVICGGEPTVWPSLPDLCRTFRRAGLAVKLDTNGTHPDRLAALMEARLIDAVAMDLKAPLDERHHEACGQHEHLDAIRRSVSLLMAGSMPYEFRTTVCPALIGPREIHAIGSHISGARRWVLQRFEPANALDPALRDVQPYDLPTMEALAAIGRQYVGRCLIRGQPDKRAVEGGHALVGEIPHH